MALGLDEGCLAYTIRHGTGPFAVNGNLVAVRQLGSEATRGADVLVRAHLQLAGVEDLVVVRVQDQFLGGAAAPAVPGPGALEGVMEGDGHIRLAETLDAVGHELAHHVHIQLGAHRLVEQLDDGDGRVVRMVVPDLGESAERLRHRIALAPAHVAALARVVQAVLAARGAVQVDHYLEPGAFGPVQSLAEVLVGALRVGVAVQRRDGPVTDGDAHEIQAFGGNVGEVALSDEGTPVGLETLGGLVLAKHLAHGELVHDVVGGGLEDGGGDPWLFFLVSICT